MLPDPPRLACLLAYTYIPTYTSGIYITPLQKILATDLQKMIGCQRMSVEADFPKEWLTVQGVHNPKSYITVGSSNLTMIRVCTLVDWRFCTMKLFINAKVVLVWLYPHWQTKKHHCVLCIKWPELCTPSMLTVKYMNITCAQWSSNVSLPVCFMQSVVSVYT